MTKIYVTTDDGQRYEAKTALDFVQQLKDSSRTARHITINQFMREMADRAQSMTGFKINVRSAKGFLESLIVAGLVKEVQAADA
jgi:hypothetical protein